MGVSRAKGEGCCLSAAAMGGDTRGGCIALRWQDSTRWKKKKQEGTDQTAQAAARVFVCSL